MSDHAAHAEKPAGWQGASSPLGISYGKMFMWFFLISDALTFSGFLCSYGFFRHRFFGEWPIPGDVFHHFIFCGDKHLPLMYVGLMTFILIMSSVTMVLAVEAGHRKNKRQVCVWMFATIIGGLMFVGSQAWEWTHFIEGSEQGAVLYMNKTYQYKVDPTTHEPDMKTLTYRHQVLSADSSAYIIKHGEAFHGANLHHNEYGHTAFADFFFFITGFHGFHVFSGVIINICIFIMAFKGIFERRGHYEMVEKVGLYWHFVDLVWVFVFTFFYLL